MAKIKVALMAIWVAVPVNGATAADPGAAEIMVTITNLETAKGEVRCALFRGPEGFPREPERAAFRVVGVIDGEVGRCVFTGIAPGPAAITVIHDENNNKKLDMRMGFIPSEGVGWSNNPKVRLAPPSFEQARFVVGAAPLSMAIRLNQR